MTSAFIIQVQPQLQSDPNEEAAALLRVLIYKIDNTTFGNDVPTVPQWSGPPRTIVQVQSILYASLAASLLSAFLGMLRKQWLARYATTDIRGSAIERCQLRQWKFDGIIAWYFDRMIESSSQVLQIALLLLCCGLSLYLWEINTTVATVILAVTLFGALFYTFIVFAGAASVSCPYQTPGAHLLRHTYYLIHGMTSSAPYLIHRTFYLVHSMTSRAPGLIRHIPGLIRRIPGLIRRIPGLIHRILYLVHQTPAPVLTTLLSISNNSVCIGVLVNWRDELRMLRRSEGSALAFLVITLLLPILLTMCLVIDAYFLVRAMVKAFVAFALPRGQPYGASGPADTRLAMLDVRCISWILDTSLDKCVHLSTLNFLATIPPAFFDPELGLTCFNILVGCVSTVGDKVVVTQGSEILMDASALGFLHVLSHLATVDPTSRALTDARRRYTRIFPSKMSLEGFPSYHRFSILHNLLHPQARLKIQWEDYDPFGTGHVAIASLVQFRYRRVWPLKVPRWALHFALHYLSQNPLPPPPVVVDCLSIIAIDLGCAVPDIITTPAER